MKKQQGFSVIEALLILVIVGLVGFVGWFVYSSSHKTDKIYENTAKSGSSSTIKSTKSKASSQDKAQTAATDQTAPAVSEATEPTASEKQQIQSAALKYLNRMSAFSEKEKTLVSKNHQFAIQYYCGPPPSDCSQVWLKLEQTGSWNAFGTGIDVQPNLSEFNKQYGWPLGFF